MTQPPHEDPFDEAKQRSLQSLSVLATIGEAAARFAAVGIQRKAADQERAAGRKQAADAAGQEARRLADAARKDRAKIAAQFDGSWIKTATFKEAAETWRSAMVYAAAGDPVAQKAAGLALDRLGELHPQWRRAYDRHRRAGHPAPDAARAAAREVWEAESDWVRSQAGAARPHGGADRDELRVGANGRALPAGGQVIDDLDAAVRAETVKLLGDVSPEALDRVQRRMRASGRVPAADPIGLARQYIAEARAAGVIPAVVADSADEDLLARAAEERARARAAAGAADNPTTPIDEYADGQVTAAHQYGAADRDAAAAQQARMAMTYQPLVVGGKGAAAASTKPKAAAPARSRGAVR